MDIPPALWKRVPEEKREALRAVLSFDPRPSYQHDPHREYGFVFAGLEVRFTVEEGRLTVIGLSPAGPAGSGPEL